VVDGTDMLGLFCRMPCYVLQCDEICDETDLTSRLAVQNRPFSHSTCWLVRARLGVLRKCGRAPIVPGGWPFHYPLVPQPHLFDDLFLGLS
jgi:hypothetical protein